MRNERRRVVGITLIALAVALPLLISASIARPKSVPIGTIGETWEMVFVDEFESAELDDDLWTWCYWWVTNGCAIGTNGELEWYQPGNISVEDGALVLTARREDVVTHDGERRAYTSGMVTTGRASSDLSEPMRFGFTYGLAEIRAKLPSGQGLWPAFWLLPATHESRPEIDVLEVLGHDVDTLRMHYHFIADGERASVGENVDVDDLSADWHVYGIEWTPERLTWLFDGVPVWTIRGADNLPHEPMYLILNLAVGGEWPGPPDASTPFPASYLIDYVRVWQYPTA